MRPKDIGTRFETSVVRYLRVNGFPYAERRALAGAHDLGDITGTLGIAWECKAGKAAYSASDGQVEAWLGETESERVAAGADLGVLVLDRSGYGPLRVSEAWAIIRADAMSRAVCGPDFVGALSWLGPSPVRIHLRHAVTILRAAGYGDALSADLSAP